MRIEVVRKNDKSVTLVFYDEGVPSMRLSLSNEAAAELAQRLNAC